MNIERIVNYPVSSNSYIIHSDIKFSRNCVVVDPGSESNENLYEQLDSLKLEPEYIILTHEHFDHCWGVNGIREKYPKVKLICSIECNRAIQSSKGNCSVFYDNNRAFEIKPADIIIYEKEYVLVCNGFHLKLVRTPGHTEGAISIIVNDNIFTGDALIPGYKTVTKLPNASVEKQIKSESFFKILDGYTIYPGHELPVKYDCNLFKWY